MKYVREVKKGKKEKIRKKINGKNECGKEEIEYRRCKKINRNRL